MLISKHLNNILMFFPFPELSCDIKQSYIVCIAKDLLTFRRFENSDDIGKKCF